jgi:hypothetical protein
MPLEPEVQKNVGPIHVKFDSVGGTVEEATYTVEFGVLNANGETIRSEVQTFTLSSGTPEKTFQPGDFGGEGLGCKRTVNVSLKRSAT